MFFPKPIKAVAYNVHQALPRVRKNHVKIFCMMSILFWFDMLSLTYCACHLLEDGPSIFIMFIFESAILMVSIMSSSTLYNLHIIDGMINVAQRLIIDRHEEINGIPEDNEADKEDQILAQQMVKKKPSQIGTVLETPTSALVFQNISFKRLHRFGEINASLGHSLLNLWH